MIRSFIEFAVKKSALNHLFLLFFVIMAIFAYMHIPKEIFPPAAMDKVQINGIYVGASADVLDKMAVDAIEDKLKGISDIKDMTSSISNGRFNIEAN
ncbi:MAG: efflux RND transporter permease subunit, partial [Thiovulaceae bacterium]|nr:efflux RND transporter permease subunit [Sulfurimonadaceae bacterium]